MRSDRSHALDHVVLVLFENRSFDNLLGQLYGPEDGKTFEGVIGKNLSNPIPEVWDLGDPFTDREAAARSFEHLLSRETPRDPATWPETHPKPLPDWQLTKVAYGEAISTLGKAIGPGLIEHARQSGRPIPAELTDPDHPPTPEQLVDFVRSIAATYFPGLVPSEAQGS